MTGPPGKVEENLSSALSQVLADRIQREGKITFRDWMKTALYHPQLGYYNRPDLKRWGKDGDYRTSPERSKLFSATFARYFANLYERLRQPGQFQIVEFGAGNGDFAAGILSSLHKQFSSIYQKTCYAIVDCSLDSQRRCMENTELYRERVRFLSLDHFTDMAPHIVFSNELLDAFPVHRVRKVDGEIKELYVDLIEGEFAWASGPPTKLELIRYCEENVSLMVEGQTIDINLGIVDWLSSIPKSTEFVVTVDYGDKQPQIYDPTLRLDGTLRAFRRHQFVDNVLESPGDCDITTSVDWTFVMNEGKRVGFEVERFERLDQFLLSEGLLAELEDRLSTLDTDAQRAELTSSAREMILPGGMASSFQILVQRRSLDEQ